MSNQSEGAEGSTSSKGSKPNEGSSPDRLLLSRSHYNSEHKPLSGLSGISGWLNQVNNRRSPSPPSSSNVVIGENMEPSDSATISGLDAVMDAARRDSGSSNSRDPDVEEEYQIQLALELSAKEDPEAVQIEAVKQISLGSCALDNTPAEVVAYRYWVSLSFLLLTDFSLADFLLVRILMITTHCKHLEWHLCLSSNHELYNFVNFLWYSQLVVYKMTPENMYG
jgi:hypothetical protein